MRYTAPTFTVPVASPRVTQVQYEVAVGLRCPKCLQLWKTMDKHICYIPYRDTLPKSQESK